MPGGYTNRTRRTGTGLVEKAFDGPDSSERLEREVGCLTGLSDKLPLPFVVGFDRNALTVMMRESRGTHGQTMIDDGHAAVVLRLLGALHRLLRSIEPSALSILPGIGDVIVHGDFGPQNVLIDNGEITALLDWEFAHIGSHVEDLAWAEWIVRMHHADHRDEIPTLYLWAEVSPPWTDRHAVMLNKCREMLLRVEHSGPSDAVELWQARLRKTERWTE